MSGIRVLVADDHFVVRLGLREMLDEFDDIEVVAEVSDADGVIRSAGELTPDLVILDLELDGRPWLETIAGIHRASPRTRILVYTSHLEPDCILGVVRADIQGYLPKSISAQELARAIRIIHAGGQCLSRGVTESLAKSLREEESQQANSDSEALTWREREVLRLMMAGKNNRSIASELNITERTVKFHVSSILGKLQVDNRTEAVVAAFKIPELIAS